MIVALSDPSMDLEWIIRAATLACIHEEIMMMPMGYETILADRGLSLSGGQRQRLAIARALAGRPKLLFFDEATSHLDVLTEERVIQNIRSLACTQVVIAHRLTTIMDADVILVMDSGRLIASGGHDVLLRECPLYAALVGRQGYFAQDLAAHAVSSRITAREV